MLRLAIAWAVMTCVTNSLAQGTIVFNNRVVGSVVAPVYAGSLNGPPLSGSGFTAQLWAAPGANQPVGLLVPATGYSTAGFRTGAAAGFWVTSNEAAMIPGAAEGSIATLQVRAWDNQSGTIATFGAAVSTGVVRRAIEEAMRNHSFKAHGSLSVHEVVVLLRGHDRS